MNSVFGLGLLVEMKVCRLLWKKLLVCRIWFLSVGCWLMEVLKVWICLICELVLLSGLVISRMLWKLWCCRWLRVCLMVLVLFRLIRLVFNLVNWWFISIIGSLWCRVCNLLGWWLRVFMISFLML